MKKTAAFVAALALVFAATASAAPGDHTAPGTPGAANCKGQTVAYLAQAGKNFDLAFRGIGGLGNAAGLSTKQIMAVVDAYCSQ